MGTTDRAGISRGDQESTPPRAIVHKQILDTAQNQPTASLEELASEVDGASVDLVERVLDEYGDPGGNGNTTSSDDHDGVTAEGATADDEGDEIDDSTADTQPLESGQVAIESESLDQLSEKQRETLRAIHERPEATQREIAEHLGVSAPTISQRVNAIEGFDWALRQQYVESLFQNTSASAAENTVADGAGAFSDEEDELPEDVVERLTHLSERVAELEQRLDERDSGDSTQPVKPELAHKMLHACLEADYIDEEEELQIIRDLVHEGSTTQ